MANGDDLTTGPVTMPGQGDEQDWDTFTIYRNNVPHKVRAPKGTDPDVMLRDFQHQQDPKNFPAFQPPQLTSDQLYPGMGSTGSNLMGGLAQGGLDPFEQLGEVIHHATGGRVQIGSDQLRQNLRDFRANVQSTYMGRTGEFIGSQWPTVLVGALTGGAAAAPEAAAAGEAASEIPAFLPEAVPEFLPRTGTDAGDLFSAGSSRLSDVAKGVTNLAGVRSARAAQAGAEAVRSAGIRQGGVSAVERALTPLSSKVVLDARDIRNIETALKDDGVVPKTARAIANAARRHPGIRNALISGTAATGAPTDPKDPNFWGQKAAQFAGGAVAEPALRGVGRAAEGMTHAMGRWHPWVHHLGQLMTLGLPALAARAARGTARGATAIGTAAGQAENVIAPWIRDAIRAQQYLGNDPLENPNVSQGGGPASGQ